MPIKSQSEAGRARRVRFFLVDFREQTVKLLGVHESLRGAPGNHPTSVLESNLRHADRLLALADRALMMDPLAMLWTKDAKLHD